MGYRLLLSLITSGLMWPAVNGPHAIDTRKSVITIHVYKAGVLSAFGHDHEIGAAVASGAVDTSARHVELLVKAADMRVLDSGPQEKDRAEVQKAMFGPEVLDVQRYPDITFRSTEVQTTAPNSWQAKGNLSLHGNSRPVTVEVNEKDGHFRGIALLKLKEFGIKPVSAAGGTIRVKDEIRIEFDIQLAP
jgi:polyisoprenoid-binding protein YceI